MSFNILKRAQSDYPHPYDKMLQDHTEDYNLEAEDDTGNIDWMLQKKQHKNKDNSVNYETQLGEARSSINNGITEKSLNENKKLFNERRLDKTWKGRVSPLNLVAEAFDQQRYKAYNQAEKEQGKKEKILADVNKGEQMIGPITKVPGKMPKSQLAQHPDRFKKLDKTMPIQVDHKDNKKTLTKEDKVIDLVSASLKDADAMLFDIYATAKRQGRNLTVSEKQMISDINSAKSRILTAQYPLMNESDHLDEDIFSGELEGTFDGEDEFEDTFEGEGELDHYIDKSDSGHGFDVFDHGQFIDHFDNLRDAVAAYPEADVSLANVQEQGIDIRT